MHQPFPNYRYTLRWRQNGRYSVSNHQPHDCLFNRLFRRRSKKTSKLRVTGLCAGNSPGPVNSPHKGPVTRKMFPFDDVIMRVRSHRFVLHPNQRTKYQKWPTYYTKLNFPYRIDTLVYGCKAQYEYSYIIFFFGGLGSGYYFCFCFSW